MDDHVYKTVEITGSSTKGIDDAIETAIARADQSINALRWFETTEVRGHIEKGRVAHWQVSLKVGFTLDEASSSS